MKQFQALNHNQISSDGFNRPSVNEVKETPKAVCEECGTVELNRSKTFCSKDGYALFWERISSKDLKKKQKQIIKEIKKRG